MNKNINKKEFESAETKMFELLQIATQKGGFELLTPKQKSALEKHTQIVKKYEAASFTIPMPQTVQGLIELKMYEKKLKQKETRMKKQKEKKLKQKRLLKLQHLHQNLIRQFQLQTKMKPN